MSVDNGTFMTIKVRFAPSPTGFLHVGGVRTALFSWLYAKHHHGKFVLRIEDTDKERSTTESVEAILEGMAWLGLDFDEGPIYQTERFTRYQEVIDAWLDEKKAYRCQCSKERLEQLREQQLARKEKPRYDGHCRDLNLDASYKNCVIRFKNPLTGEVCFKDEVYGAITVKNQELDDLILVRSDGHPTYNFAVVVDDVDMHITHVIRGDDHINNTPRQIHLFHALNAPIPIFAHLPMILGEDGKRLSKRHGAVSVLQFREEGILPEALLNYLVRLGWSAKDQEIFSIQEMIALFNLAHIHPGTATFNYEKLYWLNQHYLKSAPYAQTAKALAAFYDKNSFDYHKGPKLDRLIAVQAPRCSTLKEIAEKSRYFYQDAIDYDNEAVKKHLRPVMFEPLQRLHDVLAKIDDWQETQIQAAIEAICLEYHMTLAKLGQPLRVAVTGITMSPSLDETLVLIGQSRVLDRLTQALTKIKARMASI
tara:strand:- start:130 stop:1566 length:1437 start_codon:yes stop_codon:yes gene_type:complete